jgi:CubicO group peptidase (beta-lactamase class C family)
VGNANTWFTEEATRVGSFTQQGVIWGIFNGKANEMAASKEPLLLLKAQEELSWTWGIDQQRGLTPHDYLDRQRVMALLVIKDGRLVFERYQYDRTDKHRFLSNSMAKSVTAIAVGLALREGKIKSLDERADVIALALAGTLYGEATVRNLLRMSSGAKFEERYDGNDDLAHYGFMATRSGIAAGAKLITERAHAQGSKFNYASAETDMLAVVLQAATGQNLSNYLSARLWQPMGA